MAFIKLDIDYELLTAMQFSERYIKHLDPKQGRKQVYRLIERDRIDYTEIAGTKFIVMNKRTENWTKSN